MENSYPRKINIRFPVFLFLSFRFDKKRHCLVIKKKEKKENWNRAKRYTWKMKMNWTVSRNRFDGSRLFRWFHRSSISLNCSFPFISNFSWMKLKFFSEHLYGKTSLVSFSNYQPSFRNLKLAVDHCVYVVCTSHAFFVFEGSKLIAVLLVKKCLFFVKNRILAG